MNLPEGWRTVELKEVTEIIMGQSPPSNTYNESNDGFPFFQGKAEFGLRYPRVKKYCSEPMKIAETNDILMSVRAPVGSVNIADKKCCIGRGLCAIRVSKAVDHLYLFHFLKANEEKISNMGVGSTFTAISRRDVNNIEIPVPPLPTQQKIVSILEKAEQAKEWRKEADELTKEFLKSVFVEMFGDKKKFETKKLSEICTVESGGTPSRIEKDYWEGGTIPWLGSTVCKDCRVNESEQFITENGLKNSSARMFKKGTILVALVGATIGKTAYLNFEASTNQNIAGIYPKQNITLNSEYLFYAVQLLYPKFIALSSDTFKMANLSFVRGLEIPSPPIELQNKFASIVKEVESMKEEQKHSKEQIDKLFNALMQKAFKGELV